MQIKQLEVNQSPGYKWCRGDKQHAQKKLTSDGCWFPECDSLPWNVEQGNQSEAVCCAGVFFFFNRCPCISLNKQGPLLELSGTTCCLPKLLYHGRSRLQRAEFSNIIPKTLTLTSILSGGKVFSVVKICAFLGATMEPVITVCYFGVQIFEIDCLTSHHL